MEKQGPAHYFNFLNFHSILLQGICDHKGKFLNVCVKALGGFHDVAHLRTSSLWQKLQTNELLHRNHIQVEANDVQQY